jgi:hypothetical protein
MVLKSHMGEIRAQFRECPLLSRLRTVLEGKPQGSLRTIPEALVGRGLRTVLETVAPADFAHGSGSGSNRCGSSWVSGGWRQSRGVRPSGPYPIANYVFPSRFLVVRWQTLSISWYRLMSSPQVINLTSLIDGAKCYELIRYYRWPEGVHCTSCSSAAVIRHGHGRMLPACRADSLGYRGGSVCRSTPSVGAVLGQRKAARIDIGVGGIVTGTVALRER